MELRIPPTSARRPELVGRTEERDALSELLEAACAGKSQALVVRGEPGMGKSTLLDHLTNRADDCRVLRVVGMQSEMELIFAGLHQLCTPLLNRLDRLPPPQQAALRTAFGLCEGPPPQPLLIGLAVLSLLSEASGDQPLMCVVDDFQWLDRTSAQTLGFVARRLSADPVAMIFGTRTVCQELEGVPELLLAGLPAPYAHELLDSVLTGPLDERVRDQIVAECGGNPLALLESLRGATPDRLAGGFGLPAAVSLSGRLEENFRRQLAQMPAATRQLLRLASADPSGDALLLWRAARTLGISLHAATPAVEAGLAEFGTRVRFRHPLLRSTVYRSATEKERKEMHLALVAATDRDVDPDRRAWHRAQAAAEPDEDVAADLERSADRAYARGGPAAAAAFLERAALLSADPVRQTERNLAAVQANVQSGSYERALELLAATEAERLDPLQRARAELLRGHIAFASGLGNTAPRILLEAAGQLVPLDVGLARETYLTAWMAAVCAGGLATEGGSVPDICRAAQRVPRSPQPDKAELILDAISSVVTDGPAAAEPALRHVVNAFTAAETTTEETLRWGWFAHAAAIALWDHSACRSMLEREAEVMRTAGAHSLLPMALSMLATVTAWSGDFPEAATMIAEADMVCEATRAPAALFAPIVLACLRGDETTALPLIQASVADARTSGTGVFLTYADWAASILYNGLGCYEDALASATRSRDSAPYLFVANWALPELIEAAVRSGHPDFAHSALEQLTASAAPGGTDVGLGLLARSRALLSDGESAESLYGEAIDRLSRTPLRPELGRAHLLYGEWLRRAGRRTDARVQLRTALGLLAGMGAEAFAERARRELLATGERVRRNRATSVDSLTSQEALIARLARDGLTNAEIAAQLFLSPRTVEWHLRKVFGKLGITSRRELTSALTRAGEVLTAVE
ncbi:AAA family ATPase [Streptomyces sp. NPDC046821]|uniref:ATP-binding protein n=1 Tax=Streptomyces sp. NPDC046821 TaxID=3154702 RepID=UPI0033CA3A08